MTRPIRPARCALRLLALLFVPIALIAVKPAHAEPVPKKFEALYRELDARLNQAWTRLPGMPSKQPLLRGALLQSAHCHRGEIMLSPMEWERALRELDALKAIGVEAVVMQVCYPLLTAAFHEPVAYLERYANLANEVRLREMKLLVQHGALQPEFARVDVRPYYRKLTKARFRAERFDEAKSILLALQPDYLTLVAQPGTLPGPRLSANEWRSHVERSVNTLTKQFGAFPTLLGAGSGLWEDARYVTGFAAIEKLNYIDLQSYPLSVQGDDMLDRLREWSARIRASSPGKRMVMSEVWLGKSATTEPFKSPYDAALLAREAWGFWAPLDIRLMQLIGQIARTQGIELVALARPRYLFSYLDYDDPLTFNVRSRQLLELTERRALEAIDKGQVSDAGLALQDM